MNGMEAKGRGRKDDVFLNRGKDWRGRGWGGEDDSRKGREGGVNSLGKFCNIKFQFKNSSSISSVHTLIHA